MLDVAFDAAGLAVTFSQALACLAVGGRLIQVGLSDQEASLGTTAAFGLSKKQVAGHLGYQNTDIETLAELVSRGRLDISRSISEIVSLEDVLVGIEKLDRHEGDPIRILVRP
jgi:threonine dehydrogenase-like Zn-dependent dehydrogenase